MKIAFTSCMDADRIPSQPIWLKILDDQPDVLLLLGDQIYMDWGIPSHPPKWKTIFTTDPNGPALFAQEMHRRYALQWAVPEFQKLITWFTAKPGFSADPAQSQLMVTWDDHDFAWNNSYGAGNSNTVVPPQAKTISKALLQQFATVLRTLGAGAAYPALPANILSLPNASTGLETAPVDMGDLRFVMLDERFYRTDRGETGATVIGQGQRNLLDTALSHNPKALTIVAGGSPLKHDYLSSPQGWAGDNGQPDYPDRTDFVQLAQARKKPILYLAGDIHTNEWGGRLDGSPIVHCCASGAAIGHFLIYTYHPRYGIVDVNTATKRVQVSLKKLKNGNLQFDSYDLAYGANDWTSVGTAPGGKGDPPDISQPLGALCARQRLPAYTGQDSYHNVPLTAIDAIYGGDVQSTAAPYPDVVELRAAPSTPTDIAFSIQKPSANSTITQMLDRAFTRAIDGNKKAVVLFVHGFDKTFAESVGQVCLLREVFPDMEPVLFSWAAGDVRGLLSTPGQFLSARAHIGPTLNKLRVTMELFAAMATSYPQLKRIVVARSLGADLLSELIEVLPFPTVSGKPGIDRLVLASGAVLSKCHEDWQPGWADCAMVTMNDNDATLKWFEVPMRFRKLLGRTLPRKPAAGMAYFDCTLSPGVGKSHEYMFQKLNPDIVAMHQMLMSGQALPVAPASIPGFHRGPSNVFTAP